MNLSVYNDNSILFIFIVYKVNILLLEYVVIEWVGVYFYKIFFDYRMGIMKFILNYFYFGYICLIIYISVFVFRR